MHRLAPLLAIALTASAAGSAVASGTFTIQSDRTVGGLAVARGTPAQAVKRFGAADSRKAVGQTCDLAWAKLGLRVSFLDFAGAACRNGVAIVLTVTSRPHWRTDVGLRVGDTTARLRALYPTAKLHRPDGWWLIARKSCVETGGQPYPGLLARVANGRVRALVVAAGVCE